ncbi:glycosyltransferase family 4 protein [Acinetobacter bereziniae]|uniref:glycosyltransferase family 4 protein n=2 Tax=Acinetobacter bereziniae TaxID=106648 RepID=UPI000CA23179|nr:glycosyltransferase family 4 protein [Acinetobacter bereziniae]ATZ61921.1 glycosyltransferase WbuB [Acinetobacter bereziniae]MDV8157314.1 glycosyltransferase family 4 protein [Acinetobacter bereziniae]
MKKIYLVTEYYHPNQNTTGYLFHKLYIHLKKVYGSELSLIIKEDKNNDVIDLESIIVKDSSLNKKSLIQRLFFELLISFRFFIKIIKNVKKQDLVFTGTTPIFLLIVVYFAKKMIGFKWVLLVHDVFPENLVAAKVLKKENFLYKILKKIFDIFYAAPEKLIVIGQDMKDLVDGKTKKKNSIVIQNWIDENDIQVESKQDNEILRKLNWQNESPIFQFFGNIGRVQGVDNIVEAIKLIESSNRPKFLFMGDGAYVKQLNHAIETLNDPNIQYIGSVPQNKKSKGLNAGDIAIVTLAEGMLGLGVPSKAYFSMAADKPLLAIMDEYSEVACMIRKHRIGWVVPPEKPNLLAKAILQIIENSSKENILSSPRNVLIDNYSELVAMKKIVGVLKDVSSI